MAAPPLGVVEALESEKAPVALSHLVPEGTENELESVTSAHCKRFVSILDERRNPSVLPDIADRHRR
jgi:hypothetical protein